METILCKGLDQSQGMELKLEAKSNSNIEGKAIAYLASLKDKRGAVVSGITFGYKEDVMLHLKPKRDDAVQVTGTIYMDDSEQNLDIVGSSGQKTDLKLECGIVGL